MRTGMQEDGVRWGKKLVTWSELINIFALLADQCTEANSVVFTAAGVELTRWIRRKRTTDLVNLVKGRKEVFSNTLR